ncbi:MAG: peptidase S8, partial [Candidatus Marinimicrobia bacterium CG_4_9_14_3_um_filter_48_9]
ESVRVTLTVYNTIGQRVATLVNEEKAAGTYRVNWTPRTLASGVYLIRIQAGKFASVQKCMMLK